MSEDQTLPTPGAQPGDGQTPPEGTPPTPVDPTPVDPAPAPGRTRARATNADDAPTRYAVYDKALLRFVGPVTDKAPNKSAVKALVGDHPHEVREV